MTLCDLYEMRLLFISYSSNDFYSYSKFLARDIEFLIEGATLWSDPEDIELPFFFILLS